MNLSSGFVARLSQVPLVEGNTTICNHSVTTTHMVGDSASAAEFFVGVAIVCFLYSMVALLVYLGYMHVYKDSDFGPIFVSIDLAGELSNKTSDRNDEISHKDSWVTQNKRRVASVCRADVFLLVPRTLRSQRSWSSCGWCVRPPGRRACRM